MTGARSKAACSQGAARGIRLRRQGGVGKLIVVVQEAGSGPAMSWELTSPDADKLSGIEKRGDADGSMIAGVKAPVLDRPMPKKWTKPRPLFDGKDLKGWEPIGNVDKNKWIAHDGELVNDNPEVAGQRGHGAANIMTTQKSSRISNCILK